MSLRSYFLQFVCNFTFEKQWMAEKKRWQRNCRGFCANVAFTEGCCCVFSGSEFKSIFQGDLIRCANFEKLLGSIGIEKASQPTQTLAFFQEWNEMKDLSPWKKIVGKKNQFSIWQGLWLTHYYNNNYYYYNNVECSNSNSWFLITATQQAGGLPGAFHCPYKHTHTRTQLAQMPKSKETEWNLS